MKIIILTIIIVLSSTLLSFGAGLDLTTSQAAYLSNNSTIIFSDPEIVKLTNEMVGIGKELHKKKNLDPNSRLLQDAKKNFDNMSRTLRKIIPLYMSGKRQPTKAILNKQDRRQKLKRRMANRRAQANSSGNQLQKQSTPPETAQKQNDFNYPALIEQSPISTEKTKDKIENVGDSNSTPQSTLPF